MSGNANVLPSDKVNIVAALAPQQQAVGTVTTPWIPVTNWISLMAAIQLGVLGTAATVDAKLQQATSSAGANAKDIPNKAIAQFLHATPDDGKQALINFNVRDLDANGGFSYVQLSVTVGGAASQVAALLLGFEKRYGTAAADAAATVGQTIA
jgi:hypothetical protein